MPNGWRSRRNQRFHWLRNSASALRKRYNGLRPVVPFFFACAASSYVTLRRFRSPGGGQFQSAPCGRPTRGRQSPRPLDPGLPGCQPERRSVIKLREGFARQAAGSFSPPRAGDRQGAASRRGPLTPGSRPAHPPLRGPFAASGFLPDRQDAPSLARPDFRRRPVGSSGNPASAQRVGWPAQNPPLQSLG